LQKQRATIDPQQRAVAVELVELAASARRAFPRGQLDITATQVLLALALDHAGRGVKQTAAVLALDASTVSHALRDLRNQQLITDVAHSVDGRRRAYALTPAGDRFVSEYLRARTTPP
jgi:DNA-binding MarR family transcriptional regulator